MLPSTVPVTVPHAQSPSARSGRARRTGLVPVTVLAVDGGARVEGRAGPRLASLRLAGKGWRCPRPRRSRRLCSERPCFAERETRLALPGRGAGRGVEGSAWRVAEGPVWAPRPPSVRTQRGGDAATHGQHCCAAATPTPFPGGSPRPPVLVRAAGADPACSTAPTSAAWGAQSHGTAGDTASGAPCSARQPVVLGAANVGPGQNAQRLQNLPLQGAGQRQPFRAKALPPELGNERFGHARPEHRSRGHVGVPAAARQPPGVPAAARQPPWVATASRQPPGRAPGSGWPVAAHLRLHHARPLVPQVLQGGGDVDLFSACNRQTAASDTGGRGRRRPARLPFRPTAERLPAPSPPRAGRRAAPPPLLPDGRGPHPH